MSRLIENAKHDLSYLRNQRAKLFKAFDILKENVNFGITPMSDERKYEIINWYIKALELDYDAINNYPSELERYL
jgi:hypothetical protein